LIAHNGSRCWSRKHFKMCRSSTRSLKEKGNNRARR